MTGESAVKGRTVRVWEIFEPENDVRLAGAYSGVSISPMDIYPGN